MNETETSNVIDFFEAKRQIELEIVQRGIRELVGNNPPKFDEDGGLEEP